VSEYGIQTFYKTGEKTLDTSNSTVKVFRLCWRRWEDDSTSNGNEDVLSLGGRKSVEFNLGYADDGAIWSGVLVPIPIERTGINIAWEGISVIGLRTELLSFIYE